MWEKMCSLCQIVDLICHHEISVCDGQFLGHVGMGMKSGFPFLLPFPFQGLLRQQFFFFLSITSKCYIYMYTPKKLNFVEHFRNLEITFCWQLVLIWILGEKVAQYFISSNSYIDGKPIVIMMGNCGSPPLFPQCCGHI